MSNSLITRRGRENKPRCDAIAKVRMALDKSKDRRCTNPAFYIRDGRLVCACHLNMATIEYTCGNRFDAYGAVMARTDLDAWMAAHHHAADMPIAGA
jgi:hypothetical protein